MREHFHRGFKCDKVSRIGALDTDFSRKPLQIVDRSEIFPDLGAGDLIFIESLDRAETLVDCLL